MIAYHLGVNLYTSLIMHEQLTNTLQVVLATDGIMTFVEFRYEDIQWTIGQTTIGFNAGDDTRSFTVPESLTIEGLLDLESRSNIGIPGVFIYRVDQDQIITPPGMWLYACPMHSSIAFQ